MNNIFLLILLLPFQAYSFPPMDFVVVDTVRFCYLANLPAPFLESEVCLYAPEGNDGIEKIKVETERLNITIETDELTSLDVVRKFTDLSVPIELVNEDGSIEGFSFMLQYGFPAEIPMVNGDSYLAYNYFEITILKDGEYEIKFTPFKQKALQTCQDDGLC
ncbi:hypothetical protein ACR0ST_09765 [Aliidiomarina sp. Khilg15.8]